MMADRLLGDQGAKATCAWMQLSRFWAEQGTQSPGRTRQCQLCSFPLSRALYCQSLQRWRDERDYGSHMAVPVLSVTAREVDVTGASSGARVILPCRKWAAIKSAEETNVVLVLKRREENIA